MAHHRLQPLESVSCSCGHGYCVFCIKAYLEHQKLRASFPQSEVEWLIETHFQPGDLPDHAEQNLGTSDEDISLETVEFQGSRPSSHRRKSSLLLKSPVEAVNVETLAPDFSREDFIQYAQEITLDPDTAFKNLALSEGNTRVTNIGRTQGYVDCPDRFNFFWQVLSAEDLVGRSYVELEWSGPWIYMAVAYQSIQRYGDGKECGFGGNESSWALHCRKGSYHFWHNAESRPVTGPVQPRLGVYVDYDAGVLIFYSVQDETMTALHRVQTRFTQPLHVGLWLAVDASAVFSKLK